MRRPSVPVKRQLKQEFGFATTDATDPYQISRDDKRETQMVTGDLNAALVEWVIQYRTRPNTQWGSASIKCN
jgi:modulator of FtsH protease HflK